MRVCNKCKEPLIFVKNVLIKNKQSKNMLIYIIKHIICSIP